MARRTLQRLKAPRTNADSASSKAMTQTLNNKLQKKLKLKESEVARKNQKLRTLINQKLK
jgi:hypothetical protein